MMPGQFKAFGHRKAFVERQVRNGIDAGGRQVLVLGAGYDTLGWRLAPAFSTVNFFEIDRPETIRLKTKGIEAMGTRTNLHCLAENLGKRDLVDILDTDARWDSAAPTVIVAEGLLMYLHPEAVKRLLEQCTVVTGANSRIVFTYVGRHPTGWPDAGPWTWLVLWMLRVSGEPWLWSIADEKIGPFLEKCHWTLAQEPSGAAQGAGVERFCVAVK
jgi:methyltransferase (TIGR00027 family)